VALVQALKDGAMYSTTGPDFVDIEIVGDEVIVKCSPVDAVIVKGQSAATVGEFGDGVTQARLKVGRLEKSPWLRVTLIDAAGHKAWSNPIWRGE